MIYITLDQIKKQLRIEPDFTEDDELLTLYGDSAEEHLAAHLNCSLDDIAAENSGELPKSLVNALLIYVDFMYDNTGSGENREIPQAYWILTNPWKTYSLA